MKLYTAPGLIYIGGILKMGGIHCTIIHVYGQFSLLAFHHVLLQYALPYALYLYNIFRVSLASGFCNTVTRETVCQNVLAVAEIGERNNCIKKLFLLSGIVSVIKMSSVILV